MYKKSQHIYFVGIGGIGMSGIAEVLLNLGYRVSGSDLKTTDITGRLAARGATVHCGHAPGNVSDVDVVVVSSAIRPDNPEVRRAHDLGIPVIPRAEMLGELMRLKYGIAVAGAHGKTTTTSLIAAVLGQGGFDPTVVVGGKLLKSDTGAFLGAGDFLVAEADESDGSFLKLPPTIAVVTNIDREHMDYYRDLETIKTTFLEFLNKVPFYGLCIVCLDDENIQSIIPGMSKRTLTYGCAVQADLQARAVSMQGLRTTFEAHLHDRMLGTVTLNLSGIHNVYNALAAIAAGLELDMDFSAIQQALHDFTGIHRRFEMKDCQGGVTWIDDYAHHPSEIKMTLRAAKSMADTRVVVLFQPHRYTRTRDLFTDFMTAFYDADVLVLTDIYPAGEPPIEGVTAERFYEGLREYGHRDVTLTAELQRAAGHLAGILQPGDIFLTLGAGNVSSAGPAVMQQLRSRDTAPGEAL